MAYEKDGVCQHPSAPTGCGGDAVKAHTIQRRGSLSAIAENGHVLSGRNVETIRGSPKVSSDLASVGVANASTFRGFCAEHDNSVFRLADQAKAIDRRVAFLLSYRALAFEVHAKVAAIKAREEDRETADNGLSFEEQASVQQLAYAWIQMEKKGLAELRKHKAVYEANLQTYGGCAFCCVCVSFDQVLPINASGAFYPQIDFLGNRLQDLNQTYGATSLLAFNIIALDKESVAAFSWIGDPTGANYSFVESLRAIETTRLGNAIVRFCFEICDNLFVRPSWWNEIPMETKQELIRRLRYNMTGTHPKDGLVIGDYRYLQDAVSGRFEEIAPILPQQLAHGVEFG